MIQAYIISWFNTQVINRTKCMIFVKTTILPTNVLYKQSSCTSKLCMSTKLRVKELVTVKHWCRPDIQGGTARMLCMTERGSRGATPRISGNFNLRL